MWRGLMLTKAVEQFLRDVRWGDLDYLLIDMPPGTGDVQMGLARLLPRTDLVIVTTPAVSAQKVAIRAADMARRRFLRVAGVIENMSAFTCEHGGVRALRIRAAAGRWPRRSAPSCWARCRSSRRSPPVATPANRWRWPGQARPPTPSEPSPAPSSPRRSPRWPWPAARPACSTRSKPPSAPPLRTNRPVPADPVRSKAPPTPPDSRSWPIPPRQSHQIGHERRSGPQRRCLGRCDRLGRRTATSPDALPSEASGAGQSEAEAAPTKRGGPVRPADRRTATPPDAPPSEASRSRSKRSGGRRRRERPGATGSAGAPQRRPTHRRAKRVGADRSEAEGGDEDSAQFWQVGEVRVGGHHDLELTLLVESQLRLDGGWWPISARAPRASSAVAWGTNSSRLLRVGAIIARSPRW